MSEYLWLVILVAQASICAFVAEAPQPLAFVF